MSLRNQAMLVLAAVFIVFVLTVYVILQNTLYTAFSQLETNIATANLQRVEQQLSSDLKYIETINADWSSWTDTYDFVSGRNDTYVNDNLKDNYVATLNLNTMLFFNHSGQLVWGEFYDLADNELIPFEQVFPQAIKPDSRLLTHTSTDSRHSGIIPTARGPMLVSSRPVLTSDYQGPIAGTLVTGQLLDVTKIASLQKRAHVPVQLWPVMSEELPQTHRPGVEQLLADAARVAQVGNDNWLSLLSLLRDIDNQPLLVLQVDTPRDVTVLGSKTINLTLLLLLVAGIVVMVVIWLLLHRLLLQPLAKLTTHILDIGNSSDLSKTISVTRQDEIGVLATEFGHMQARLVQTQRELLKQSYNAGMAENAAGVLHNVRNALTPLTSRISRLTDDLRNPIGVNIPRAINELNDPASDPQRRAKLFDYVRAIWQKETDRHETLLADLDQANDQLNHIAAVLNEQEKFTYSEPVLETVALTELIEEAVTLLPDLDTQQVCLHIEPSIAEAGTVTIHRISIVQILNNLLVNALESLSRANRETGAIVLSADQSTQDGQVMIELRVADNGAGIASDQLDAIFNRGFTSKPKGKGGLGLHWCANTINALGGNLIAASNGIDHGAEFRLRLPIH